MFKKSSIIILIGICAIIVASALSYVFFVKPEPVVPVQPIVNDDNVAENKINEDDITKDWQVYRNEEYGFEIKYPKEIIGAEIKLRENKEAMCQILIYLEFPYLESPWEDLAEAIVGINGYKISSDEIDGRIRMFIDEWRERTMPHLESQVEIIIPENIKARKVSSLNRYNCIEDCSDNFDEDLEVFYYIPDYDQNLLVVAQGSFTIEKSPFFSDPPYWQTKNLCQNQFREMIIFEKIISTFRFIK